MIRLALRRDRVWWPAWIGVLATLTGVHDAVQDGRQLTCEVTQHTSVTCSHA